MRVPSEYGPLPISKPTRVRLELARTVFAGIAMLLNGTALLILILR